MTGIDWNKYPVIPGFDVLKWKEENHARILRETDGMTREEVREYIRMGSEAFRRGVSRQEEEVSKRVKS